MLALPWAVGAVDLRLGAVVLGGGVVAALAVLMATALVPAGSWARRAGDDPLARTAGAAAGLLRSHFLPGGVAAAGFVVGSLLRG
ncbi:hypothetical protein ACE7GA_13810 [Roseomonas sp. CCTCC AB2023176]|uniref:hypothetical protein n=1 Tax=Roseomonas sp. CCTCC AB2023176 TaxID=3342640 RepID=UPI0035DF2678